jgi:hypothetical protein
MPFGVTVDFNANVARFSQQIDRISGDLGRFEQRAETMSARVSKAFGALGVGLSVAGVAAFVKSGIDAADALNDMADRTGITVENLAGLQLGLKLSDSTMEAFAASANKLSINIAKNREEFEQLGITAKDPTEAFLQLADVFSQIQDPQERAAFGAKVLGKNYAELAPLLMQGSTAIREQMKAGQEWSGVTTDMAKQAAEFNDQLDTLLFKMNNLSIKAVGPLIGDLNSLIGYFGDLHGSVSVVTRDFDEAGDSWKPFETGLNTIIEAIAEFDYYISLATRETAAFFKQTAAIATLDFSKFAKIDEQLQLDNDNALKSLNKLYLRVEEGNKNARVDIGTAELSQQILDINGQVSKTIDRIDSMETANPVFQAIDKALGKNVEQEKQKLEGLLKERQALLAKYNAPAEEAKTGGQGNKPLDDAVSRFVTGGKAVSETHAKAGASMRKTNQDTADSINRLSDRYDALVEDFQRAIALNGDNSEAAKVKYEAASGSLKALTDGQKAYLISLASEKDALEKNADAYKEREAMIERLTQKFAAPRQDFIGGLGDVQDALNAGIIDETRAKSEFDKLGKAYNDSFIDPAKKGTDEMSQFSIQAARNMQDAFAEFLFDPFNASTGDMVDNFATALRKMAAEAVSAQIFDALKSSFSGSSSGSGGSDSGGFLSGLGSLFGSSGSSSAPSASAGSSSGFFDTLASWGSSFMSLFASANGNVFQGGNVVPFAKGGVFDGGNVIPFAKGDIFDKPVTFPMRDGRTGLMAEAGPEAIMPLTRGPDGKLGVRASGSGGSGGGMTIIQNLYFDSSTPRDVRRATGQAARDALGMLNGAARYG